MKFATVLLIDDRDDPAVHANRGPSGRRRRARVPRPAAVATGELRACQRHDRGIDDLERGPALRRVRGLRADIASLGIEIRRLDPGVVDLMPFNGSPGPPCGARIANVLEQHVLAALDEQGSFLDHDPIQDHRPSRVDEAMLYPGVPWAPR